MEGTFGLVYPSIPYLCEEGGRRGRKSYLSSNGGHHSISGKERAVESLQF